MMMDVLTTPLGLPLLSQVVFIPMAGAIALWLAYLMGGKEE